MVVVVVLPRRVTTSVPLGFVRVLGRRCAPNVERAGRGRRGRRRGTSWREESPFRLVGRRSRHHYLESVP